MLKQIPIHTAQDVAMLLRRQIHKLTIMGKSDAREAEDTALVISALNEVRMKIDAGYSWEEE